MPVEDDINLDNPEGLTQDDLDVMKRQAEELEDLAEDAENNAEKIMEARKAMEGMSFKQIDLIREGPSSESFEGIGGESDNELIIRILAKLKEADDERKKNTDAIKKAEQERKDLETKIKQQQMQHEARIRGALPSANAKISQGFAFQRNPIQMAKGGFMNAVRGLGPWGFVAAYAVEMIQSIANQVIQEIKGMYEDGGVLDVRKDTLNAIGEVSNLKHIIDVDQGRVFFTSDTAEFLRQGIPQSGNTRELVNGHKQYIQEFDR